MLDYNTLINQCGHTHDGAMSILNSYCVKCKKEINRNGTNTNEGYECDECCPHPYK